MNNDREYLDSTFLFQIPTLEETIRRIDEYNEWWKTLPPSEYRSVAIAQNGHTKRRLEMIIKGKKNGTFKKPQTPLMVECEGLEECEGCGEKAWDGYICHSCGLKVI
jgi:hypothetical protein